jgi:hypothetical protein
MPAEPRCAVIRRTSPSVRERPIIAFGVERPDVEILDPVPAVHVKERGALAKRAAQKTSGVAPRAVRLARKQVCLGLTGELGQSQDVISADSFQRPDLAHIHRCSISSSCSAVGRHSIRGMTGCSLHGAGPLRARHSPLQPPAESAAGCPARPTRNQNEGAGSGQRTSVYSLRSSCTRLA